MKNEKNKVFGFGNKKAKIMLIGIAPGKQEIKQGKPFVGPAGKWLDKILKKSGIDRKKLYITNVVKIKTPNNRKPNESEIRKFIPILKKEIKTIRPKLIILLGETASKNFIKLPFKDVRGKFIKQKEFIFLPVYHPSAARFTKIRKKLEEDFAKVRLFEKKY